MAYLDSVFIAAKGYVNSGNTAKWAEAHQDAFELYASARALEKQHGK